MLQLGTESIAPALGPAYFINTDKQSCASYCRLLHNSRRVNINNNDLRVNGNNNFA